MEHISKNNSLESAKNRLDISGLTYIEGTKYVYDRIINKGLNAELINYMPLVKTNDGYVLRYKNLMRQYYWLINEFVPSCSYEKLCMRNGEKTWIQYENACDALRKYVTFSFYDDDELVATISVASGNTATPFTPSKVGYDFEGWTTENGGNVFFDFSAPITEDTSVYAKYEIKEIEIRFILNNDKPDIIVTVNYGDMPSITSPEKEGYTFVGWYPEIVPATKNTTYEATYTQDIYIIRFFDIIDAEHVLYDYNNQPINGGSTSEYRLVKTETHALHDHSTYYLTKPTYQHFECAEEAGYTWWIDRNGNPIPEATFLDVTHDILDVFPKLTKKQYTVTFLDWDNREISTQTIEYLDSAIAPTDPERQNYTFTGWDAPYTGVTNNTVVHATYVGEDINVTYMLPDIIGTFTVFSSITSTFNSTAPTVQPPKTEIFPPADYGIFDGWYADSTYTEEFDYTVLLQSDTTIYGKWKTEFEVTFYNWDGTLITGDTQTGFANPVYVSYGEDVTDEELDFIIYNMIDKPGYEFLGWNKPTTGITYDVRITAVFDDTQMCLVRFINSIDGSVISSTTVPFGTTILRSEYPSVPEVEHMTFSRWDGNTSEVFVDMDVYAMYEYSDITVYFLDYNHDEIGSETIKYGQTGFTPNYVVNNIDAMGYNGNDNYIVSTLRFNGVYCLLRDEFDTETGCSIPEETIITEENNKFIAQYDEIATAVTTYNVRFYNYDSAYWFTDTVLYGTVIDSAYSADILSVFADYGSQYIPDPNNQEFYGWADDNGNEYIIGQNELTVTRSMNLYARYKMISYNVQFYVQSNPDYYPEVIDMPIHSLEIEALKNTAINRPDCSNVPERIYFETFCYGLNNRWYIDSACTIEWKFKQDIQMQPVANPDLVADDMILYGKYIGNEYTLTYNTNGGSSITQETYRYPMPTVRPANPTKQDSTFMGWYVDDGTFETEFVFGGPLTDDITIYAKWFEAPEENTIIYNASADLRQYMPDMGSAHLVQEQCIWDAITFDGVLVYDAPIEEFNIGTLNRSNNVTVNTEIKRNLRTITIPSQVTEVVRGQFEDCRYLYAINASEDNNVFNSKNGILYSISRRIHTVNIRLECYPQAKVNEDFILNDLEVAGFYVTINDLCFANCKKLKTIHLNENVLAIKSKAFLNCINLEEITCDSGPACPDAELDTFEGVDTENCKLYVPCQSYNSYAEHAVWGQFDIQCNGTVLHLSDSSTVVIEDNILTKGLVADVYSNTLVACEIGNNVTAISAGTFFQCSSLTSVTIPNSVTNIDTNAFNHCESLTSVVVPGSVESIGDGAFILCTSLTNAELHEGIKSIGNDAFAGCTGLVEIYIPYTVRTIRETAFHDCSSLRSITIDAVTPPEFGQDVFDGSNCPIYVPCDSVDDYKAVPNLIEYENRIQCSQETGTILYLNDSSTVVIPDNVLTQALISDVYSGTVVSCEIGDNVTEIGNNTFRSCTSLSSVTIPSGVTNIGTYAFYNCSSLISVTIPDGITSIKISTFERCTSLTSVTVPNSVTGIGEDAFMYCYNLMSINISENHLNSIGGFGYCYSLTSITIPSSVTYITDDAFRFCTGLTSVDIPDGVIGINLQAFSYCYSLTSMTIPSGVEYIEDYAFYECRGLTSIICEPITPPLLTILDIEETQSHAFDYTHDCPIYVPSSSVSRYKSEWPNYSHRIMANPN